MELIIHPPSLDIHFSNVLRQSHPSRLSINIIRVLYVRLRLSFVFLTFLDLSVIKAVYQLQFILEFEQLD